MEQKLLGYITRTLGLELVIRCLEEVERLQNVLKLRADLRQLLIDQPSAGGPRVCAVLRRRRFVHTLSVLACVLRTWIPVALRHLKVVSKSK